MVRWRSGRATSSTVWATTTQNVSGIGGEFAKSLTAKGVPVDAANVEIICQMMGGGFGSKFAADPWGVACAQLAKTTGRPVKLMLERDQELMEAGSRPSLYARVKIAAKKDGTLTAWQSDAWGTSGPQAQSPLNLPYLLNFPNRSANFTAVLTNTGPIRAWRAPNAPQQCYMTMCPFDDLAAKLQNGSGRDVPEESSHPWPARQGLRGGNHDGFRVDGLEIEVASARRHASRFHQAWRWRISAHVGRRRAFVHVPGKN